MSKETAPIRLARALHWMASEVHTTAVSKGWWPQDRNNGELLALCHSELSEAFEGMLSGNPPDDKVPSFRCFEAELADTIIRVLDMSAARKWNVPAVVAELVFNDPLAVANQTEIPVGSDEEFQSAWHLAARRTRELSFCPQFRVTKKNDGELIAHLHLELSRALESLRKPTHQPGDRTGEETALAKLIVLAMKIAHVRKLPLAEAIVAKATMNRTREIRHGGKAF